MTPGASFTLIVDPRRAATRRPTFPPDRAGAHTGEDPRRTLLGKSGRRRLVYGHVA